MQLSIREAAAYLNVDEATLRRWVRSRGVPVHRADERLYLNPIELWQWAMENGVPVSRRLLEQARRQPDQVPALSELLTAGGIHYGVAGDTKSAVLREIVALLPVPPEDRDSLVTVLEAREAMGSTGIGDGIAIPHARNPILLHVPAPFVTLCLVRHPVEFDAVDGKPVHALFSVVSPTVPAHLRILAQLAFVLRDTELRQLLSSRADAETIMDRVRALEARASGMYVAPSDTA